jgi:hypothetical protein
LTQTLYLWLGSFTAARVDGVDGLLPRIGLARRAQGEHAHEREDEHRQKPQ